MNGIIIEKLRTVKEGIFTEVKNKIKQIESISTNFNSTNLKIHDVSYYLGMAQDALGLSDGEAYSLFEVICEDEYRIFEEWEQENLNYVKRSYIRQTSSFYYQSDWCGNIIDNAVVVELLEGKMLLKESLGGLNANLYDYLQDIKKFDEIEFNFDDEEELDDFLENETELLELLSDDLDTVLIIVNEAKRAYDCISDYKTEKNEYAVAKDYLEHDLENYIAESKAENLFEQILEICTPLNKIEYLNLTTSTVNEEYVINVTSNVCETNIDTNISCAHELSGKYVEWVIEILTEKIEENFEF